MTDKIRIRTGTYSTTEWLEDTEQNRNELKNILLHNPDWVMESETDLIRISNKANNLLKRFEGECNTKLLRIQIATYLTDQIVLHDGYIVVCDETNNTPDDVDNNRLNVDVLFYNEKRHYGNKMRIPKQL